MIDPILPHEVEPIPDRTLRQFGVLCALVLGGAAAYEGIAYGHLGAAMALAAIGAGLGLLGLIRPRALRPLFSTLIALTMPIGLLISNLLLTLLFYGIFTPVALIFRLIGRDALGRRRSAAVSYWKSYPDKSALRRYFRQY